MRRGCNVLLYPFGVELRRVVKASAAVVPAAWDRRGGETAPGTVIPYRERAEYGPSNIETKLENVSRGIPFECPDIVNLNLAVVGLLNTATRIVELGSGTGTFAYAAAQDAGRFIVASEFDARTCAWARANRSRPNIRFVSGPVDQDEGPFDVVVAVEVIEHIKDFVGFLGTCTRLAPRALVTTPNRFRDPSVAHAGPPPYFKHVREWTAGEFYWVLRCFYSEVRLYAMASDCRPEVVCVNVNDRRSPLIADCRCGGGE